MISEETVTQTWQRIARISPQEAQRYMHQMSQEQPAVLAYLLTMDGDPFNRNEMGHILFIALVVWQIMKQSPQGLRSVPIEAIEQADEANFSFLEQLLTAGEMDFETAVVRMIAEYPEPEVLRYIVEALTEEDEEEPFRDEYRGLAFVNLKTVLDAFIASPARAAQAGRKVGPSAPARSGMEYNPLVAPDPEEWLSMDEGLRVQMVLEYHRKARIRIPNPYLHAIAHTIVENQAALGDETPVEQTLRRLMDEGLDRHDAIHAVGSVLIHHVWQLLHEEGRPADVSDPNVAYFEEVRQLTAQKWLQEYTDDVEVEPRPRRARRRRHPRPRSSA